MARRTKSALAVGGVMVIMGTVAVVAASRSRKQNIEGLIATCPYAVTWEGWRAIDAIETAAGVASGTGRPRVKLTEWAALREAAKGVPSGAPRS